MDVFVVVKGDHCGSTIFGIYSNLNDAKNFTIENIGYLDSSDTFEIYKRHLDKDMYENDVCSENSLYIVSTKVIIQ